MQTRATLTDRRFASALAISLALHAALLALQPAPSRPQPPAGDQRSERLDITLAPPAAPKKPAPPVARTEPAEPPASRKPPRPTAALPRILTAPVPSPQPAAPPETDAEVQARHDAVARFFEEIKPAPPPSGAQLSQQALAMARGIARERSAEPPDDPQEAPFRKPRTPRNDSEINPLSMELYFEAFVQKLNRSAAFVAADRRERGADVAVVRVELNADGTLKRYRILTAADQQVEIEYVRRVVERAAPFAAFPPDIRREHKALSFEICILPPRAGSTGGFSRTFGGHDCRDLG